MLRNDAEISVFYSDVILLSHLGFLGFRYGSGRDSRAAERIER